MTVADTTESFNTLHKCVSCSRGLIPPSPFYVEIGFLVFVGGVSFTMKSQAHYNLVSSRRCTLVNMSLPTFVILFSLVYFIVVYFSLKMA